MVVASIYAACKEMDIPRRLEDISKAADADNIFAGKCFRIMTRELSINSPSVDATRYMSRVAENADVSQKTCRTALDILDIVKKNPISYGKDPKAVATATLYCACLVGEKDKRESIKNSKSWRNKCSNVEKKRFQYTKTIPRDTRIETKRINQIQNMKGREYSNHGIVWKKSELYQKPGISCRVEMQLTQLRGHIVTSINNNYQP